MNIVQAAPYYPPHRGGLEMVAYHITWGMRKRGHRVHVVTTNTGGDFEGFKNHADTHRLPITFKIYNTPVSLKAHGIIEKLAKDADLIHTYAYPVYFSDISAHVAAKRGIPLLLHWVVDPRQAVIYKESQVAKLVTEIYFKAHGNRVFRKAKMIIVPSKSYRKYLINHGVPEEKIEIVPCGIDTSLFNPEVSSAAIKNDSEFTVLFVGRISDPQKGFDVLLKAFPEVLQEHPDTQLAVVGLPDQLHFWGRIQKDLARVKGHVRFLGNLPRKEMAEWYATADLLAFPSRYESFGIVVIEAMGCGTPVVGTSVGAVTDLIKQAGILVRHEDPRGLADAINRLLSDSKLRKKLGRNASRLVLKQYSWEKVLDKYEAIYQTCVMKS